MKSRPSLLLPLAALGLCSPFVALSHDGVATNTTFMGVDTNSNRLSDVYESLYSGSATAINPHADDDKDGVTNEDEAAAGTSFRDNKEVFGVASVSSTETTVTGRWNTKAGKLYQLQASSGLNQTWVNEGAEIPGTGAQVAATCPANGSRMFLRVVVKDHDSDGDGATDWEEIQAGTNPTNWDTDGDGRNDKILVQGLATAPSSVVNVTASRTWMHEGTSRPGQFLISRRSGLAPLTVGISLGGTATPGSDYTASRTASVTLPAGAVSAVVDLTVMADQVLEEAETVTLALQPGSGYTLGSSSSATVTIVSQGLIGEYFNNASGTYVDLPGADTVNFTGLAFTRRDAKIDFDWLGVAPAPVVDDDNWTARWQGFVIPRYSEIYQLHTIAHRGVKIYCSPMPITGTSGQLRINQWSTDTTNLALKYSGNMVTGSLPMVAGQPYYIRVDCRDSTTLPANSNIKVMWSSPTQSEEVIPSTHLTSEGFIGTAPIISSSLVSIGITGAPFSYRITGSNTPTTFFADGLPNGLTVDPATGIISGVISGQAGLYFPTIRAANGGGADVKNMTLLVIGTDGVIDRQVWTSGFTGTGVAGVPTASAPTVSGTLTTTAVPSNTGDNFGDKVYGLLTAPFSGNYQFFVAADENVELHVSSNADPVNVLKRSYVRNAAGAVPAGNFTTVPTQQSLNVKLKAGDQYYFEAVRREGSGSDHLSIAWKKPGDTAPEVIPSYALSRYQDASEAASGTLYIANMTPQNGAATLGSGSALLSLSQDKTEAVLSFTFNNLTGPITSMHVHDSRDIPGPTGAIIFDIDDAEPDAQGNRVWDIIATGTHTTADVVAAIEGGSAYINLHTNNFPTGEISGFFRKVNGARKFTPPPAAPAAELALPADITARRKDIARFLQQATFGARHDRDGVAPWDPDSIEAVEALGYAGWIDAQLAISKGPDPEQMTTQILPPRNIYREPTAALRRMWNNPPITLYNGAGPMATWVKNYYEKFPLGGVITAGGPNESADQIWAAWWAVAPNAADQLRHRVAFALTQIFVVSEEGELDEQTRAMVHYNDLLYYYGLGNFRTLIEKVSLNPAMGRYLDMLNNKKPNPATGYIPNENYAREIKQLFSIGLRRLHPDGSLALDANYSPVDTYGQEEVVGLAHALTGWIQPGSGNDYVRPMTTRASDHDIGEKLLLNNTVLPAVTTATTAGMNQVFADTHELIFQHPNTAPFIVRQLIQRMVSANPSPGYIYRTARVFDDNGSGVRGDMAAVVKAILLDPEARNASYRTDVTKGKLKEPVLRATQLLRATQGFSYGEVNYGSVNMLGAVTASPNAAVDLSVALPLKDFSVVGTTTLFPGNVVILTGQNPTAENGTYIFQAAGQPLTLWTDTANQPPDYANRVTFSTDTTNLTLPVVRYPAIEGVLISNGNRLLIRNQVNPAENGVYVAADVTLPLVRWDKLDEPAEFAGARVTVSAYRDPTTLAYSAKTFGQTATVTTVGTDPVVWADSSRTSSGAVAWHLGSTGGGSFNQTPLRAPTVFNFFEPDYVFLEDTGRAGLYSPEFQITSETSVVTTANWFNTLALPNNSSAAAHSTGQGTSYSTAIGRDVKLDYTPFLSHAEEGGMLVDRLSNLLLPGQLTPALRTVLANYINQMPATLSPRLSSWKWFTDATGLGNTDVVVGNAAYNVNNWKHPNFDDTAWSSGAAPLGYGQTSVVTTLPFGGVSTNKWATAYFRKEFTLASTAGISQLQINIRRDDGAIIYLNGAEVARSNVPANTVYNGTQRTPSAGDDGAAYFTINVPPTALTTGRNVISVEVHQNSASSGDLVFDCELKLLGGGAGNMTQAERVARIGEAIAILSLTPEFALQN